MNIWITVGIIPAVSALDVVCYAIARYPERTRSFGYKLIGGGVIALLRFGLDDEWKRKRPNNGMDG